MFSECSNCVATPFCPVYLGTQKVFWKWCKAKFRLDKALELSNIPTEYINSNIYNFSKDSPVYGKIKVLVGDVILNVSNGCNYYFWGKNVGTGKTFTALTLLNHYIYKSCLTGAFDFENPLGMYVSYPDLMNDLRYKRDNEVVFQQVEKVKNVPVLVLDDIGSGTISDFTVEQTYLIVNYRFNNKFSTITTSNMTPRDLGELIGQRNASRLLRDAMLLEFKGKDRRL